MSRIHRKIVYGIGAMMLVVVLIVGCSLFEREQSKAPTAPVSAAQAANFFALGVASDFFEWHSGFEVFCVNVPEEGDYLLTYTTMISTFDIAFRALEPTLLYVGLTEGDELVAAPILQRGDITINLDALLSASMIQAAENQETTPINDGRVIRVATPTDPTVNWYDVFQIDGNAPPIDLPKAEGICPVPPQPQAEPPAPPAPVVNCDECSVICEDDFFCMAEQCPTCTTCEECEIRCEGSEACMTEWCPDCPLPPVDCEFCAIELCGGTDLGICMPEACPTCDPCATCCDICEGDMECQLGLCLSCFGVD